MKFNMYSHLVQPLHTHSVYVSYILYFSCMLPIAYSNMSNKRIMRKIVMFMFHSGTFLQPN